MASFRDSRSVVVSQPHPTTPKSPSLIHACSMPPFLRRRCQSMLAAQWTHRVPLLQHVSPAHIAANLVIEALEKIEREDSSKFTVVDFCSGGGGPTPVIEKLVNAKRAKRGQKAISFVLTDLHPHLDEWMVASTRSPHLSFIPQPVDATNPPASAMNATSHTSNSPSDCSSTSRIFRLYCLSFHHFDDKLAQKTMASTLETSDGFAIIELQDRHISSLLLMCAELILLYFVTALWFSHDLLHLMFTYPIPILPPIHAFDGFISCLRTRTFDEIIQVINTAMGITPSPSARPPGWRTDKNARRYAERGAWLFEGGRVMHTFPLGHCNWVIGRRRREAL